MESVTIKHKTVSHFRWVCSLCEELQCLFLGFQTRWKEEEGAGCGFFLGSLSLRSCLLSKCQQFSGLMQDPGLRHSYPCSRQSMAERSFATFDAARRRLATVGGSVVFYAARLLRPERFRQNAPRRRNLPKPPTRGAEQNALLPLRRRFRSLLNERDSPRPNANFPFAFGASSRRRDRKRRRSRRARRGAVYRRV